MNTIKSILQQLQKQAQECRILSNETQSDYLRGILHAQATAFEEAIQIVTIAVADNSGSEKGE